MGTDKFRTMPENHLLTVDYDTKSTCLRWKFRLKNELKQGMKKLDQKMSIRLGAIMVAGIGIIAFLVKL